MKFDQLRSEIELHGAEFVGQTKRNFNQIGYCHCTTQENANTAANPPTDRQQHTQFELLVCIGFGLDSSDIRWSSRRPQASCATNAGKTLTFSEAMQDRTHTFLPCRFACLCLLRLCLSSSKTAVQP